MKDESWHVGIHAYLQNNGLWEAIHPLGREGTYMLNHATDISRRTFVGAGLAASAAIALAACSSDGASGPGSPSGDASTSSATKIDADAFRSLVGSGPVADDATVAGSSWAQAIKGRGTLLLGGVETSTLFSQLDDTDGKDYGFDAGLSQLLTRYVLGDASAYKLTQVTSDTRESVLQNGQVDCVFATYSISDDRKKVVSFAGPYYESRQGILVAQDNADIQGIEDLAGKNVAVQSGSTGPDLLSEAAPDAKQQLFQTSSEAEEALSQGRVDAYAFDLTLLESVVAEQPESFKIVGDPFGPVDPYGIGLPLDSDGVSFVNSFLQQVEDDGTWAKLWQIAIGDRTNQITAPEPPRVGEV